MKSEERKSAIKTGLYYHLPRGEKILKSILYTVVIPVFSIPIYALSLVILCLAAIIMFVATPLAAPYIAYKEFWCPPELNNENQEPKNPDEPLQEEAQVQV